MPENATELGVCHGYLVLARDGAVGRVATPLFPPTGGEADYVMVRIDEPGAARFPIVPAALVVAVERVPGVIRVDGSREEIARLPDDLPLRGW